MFRVSNWCYIYVVVDNKHAFDQCSVSTWWYSSQLFGKLNQLFSFGLKNHLHKLSNSYNFRWISAFPLVSNWIFLSVDSSLCCFSMGSPCLYVNMVKKTLFFYQLQLLVHFKYYLFGQLMNTGFILETGGLIHFLICHLHFLLCGMHFV